MRIERVDLGDADAIGACHQVHVAAQQADDPELPPMPAGMFRGWLTVGWTGEPREVWLAREETGTLGAFRIPADGYYRLELPDKENLDQADLHLVVHPKKRRRGIGRALLRHAVARSRAHGRSVLSVETQQGSAGDDFAKATGAARGITDARRMLDLDTVTEGLLARLRGPAELAAAGYSLVSWTGPTPDELLEQVAELYTALNDAPRSPGAQAEVWDAQRVRERSDDLLPQLGMGRYSVAARHDATGEIAALTQASVDPADPDWGFQGITAVTRQHRGHRLGLLVKIAMLELLAAEEPQLKRIVTWNGESNAHMIAINAALGYEISGPLLDWWRLNTADAASQV
jgi:GNAT superfamily N-acetyltransferase/RimJ/RimL family protein N-acetyltransferase